MNLYKHTCTSSQKQTNFSKINTLYSTNITAKAVQNKRKSIPKDSEEWIQLGVNLIKRKSRVSNLSDKEIRQVLIRSKAHLSKKYRDKGNTTTKLDKDDPPYINWTIEQVAEWIDLNGFPHLKPLFIENCISGRHLIKCDASALNQMGMSNFEEIKAVTKEVRKLLQIPEPNEKRAMARHVPWESFLKKRSKSGESYNLTFKEFCEQEGFPYNFLLQKNKSAVIPRSCELIICAFEDLECNDDETSDVGSEYSLQNAPSVEFVARKVSQRNKIVQKIIEELIKASILESKEKMDEVIDNLVEDGFEKLGMNKNGEFDGYRMEFATSIAKKLIKELLRTVEILKDLEKFKETISFNPDIIEKNEAASSEFLNEVYSLSLKLLSGFFELENIFKDQPEFLQFVNEISKQAEIKANNLYLTANNFINEIVNKVENLK